MVLIGKTPRHRSFLPHPLILLAPSSAMPSCTRLTSPHHLVTFELAGKPLSSSPTAGHSCTGAALHIGSSIRRLSASTKHSSRAVACPWCSPTSLIYLFCLVVAGAPPPHHRVHHGWWQVVAPPQSTLFSPWSGLGDRGECVDGGLITEVIPRGSPALGSVAVPTAGCSQSDEPSGPA
jgi:hypothetical protein